MATAKPGATAGKQDKAAAGGEKPKKPKKPLKFRFWRGVIIFLLLCVAGMYGWKWYSDGQWADEVAAAKKDCGTSESASTSGRDGQLLTLAGVMGRWAAKDVAARDVSAIDVRILEIIKQPNVEKVVAAGQDGIIFAASDKKVLGQAMTNNSDVVAITQVEGHQVVTVPLIHGVARVGTLQLWWKPPGKTDRDAGK